MKRFLSLLKLRDESGAALVIVAISMVALLGLTALVIDGGRLYLEKSKLQKAVDAAVLAGAQGLTTNQARAIENAEDVSQKNGYPLIKDNLTLTNDSIKAVKQINVPLTFARVLGINTADVSATAKAIIAPLKSAKGIAPIAVEKSAVPDKTNITCGNVENESGKNSPGNCGFLDIDGNGAPDVEDGIKNGSKKMVSIGDKVSTETGDMNGPIKKAVETDSDSLINSDKDKDWCQSAATADNTCKRVIYIAIIDSWESINGKKQVEILGFAPFWVKEYDSQGKNKSIVGQFINSVTAGEIGESGSYNYLKGVKLVE
ncbi:pilus assembly protein [Bacillus salipaludis]|uniref:Pilus assembly protein n=1 Tax=Bacillus salipaludis TaxID=2547811 RepID=A0A4R5VTQ4_9BACI|nr:TadE/TadG family type IV pilus assembly protein [Bacillus salipaludis]MDQ6600273.1 pilus assembly protein [Bacillus salipaludis]TDK62279.1 pilus assembly protein [Bacillus salipaludis]